MKQIMNWEEVQFLEYLQGGSLPPGREEWIITKAQIELATIQAFELAERHLMGIYTNNDLTRIVYF